MVEKIDIIAPFFEEPHNHFLLRELAKKIQKNPMTIRNHVRLLLKEGYLLLNKKTKPYQTYRANVDSPAYRNLKWFYNLEKIRISGLLEFLQKRFDYPVVILFGSYAKATDDEKSDLDLCVITPIQTEHPYSKFEKVIKRPINIRFYTPKQWKELRMQHPDLVNSICNGIVLSGQIEVV